MIKLLKKLNTCLILSALVTGIVFCLCGFTVTLPKGVTVNGCDVGGLTRSAAAALIRGEKEKELKTKKLVVSGEKCQYVFSFPEISYKDNVQDTLRRAKRKGSYTANFSYYLCGLNEVVAAVCESERVLKEEPYAEFKTTGAPFIYHEGHDGKEVDAVRLKNDILSSLKGGFEQINVRYLNTFRQNSLHTVKQNTVLLGRYTTYFDQTNINRASNIRLAAELLNGVIIQGGETLSFNKTVGARLPERGFLKAKIIENGEYTEGVGGGVCQVSTTLYNAALLSGMAVTEFHPHSLAVGYVEPSRDAMVSGSACDLKFRNPSKYPVYLRSHTAEGSVSFEFYGKSDGAKYSLESVILGYLPAPEEQCADPSDVREGRDGVRSEGYLLIERSGYVKRVKLRRDKYLPQKRLVYTLSDGEETAQDGAPG